MGVGPSEYADGDVSTIIVDILTKRTCRLALLMCEGR